jgi:uncharacterized protein (TIGR00375 family)
MDIDNLSKYAALKGIKLLGTGDFTHPLWLSELKFKLKEEKEGLFKYNNTYFILTTEVCNIFKYKGQIKKVHNIIFAPDFKTVEKLSKSLSNYGNLDADGRPILTLSCKDLVKLTLDISSDCLIVPAHVWTPWFSLFGANSGFDNLYDCFEEESKNIYALETGLSSDPKMNWRLSSLDKYTLISNSDSHSPAKIGREANVLNTELNYYAIINTIKDKNKDKFLFTIEFFPQEGKYHYNGHRKCNIRLSPEETKKNKYICPNCGRKVTIGVMHRIESLADRSWDIIPKDAIPFRNIIPLQEIIAQVMQKTESSALVQKNYIYYLNKLGTEFDILLDIDYDSLSKYMPEELVWGIINMREGKVEILPGYDGEYGQIKVITERKKEATLSQMSLF